MNKLRKDSKMAPCINKAVQMYRDGLSTTEIGAHFHVDPSNVYRVFKRLNVQMRNRRDAIHLCVKQGRWNVKRGKENHLWRGGKSRHSKGYILLRRPDHPRADARGYVFEHILVAEKILGRPIEKHEVVHHRNFIKDDNRPANLIVMTISEHQKLHAEHENGLIGCNKLKIAHK